jgi:hypothetical protein
MHLQLRFTQAETSLAPAELAAFAAVDHQRTHKLLREQQADHDDSSALGDLIAASIVASRLRVIDDEPTRVAAPVFVPQRHWPIPAISTDSSTEMVTPTVDEFVLADHAYGHFAWPRRRTSRVGTALVLAACIPMFLPDTAAAQAAGARQPAAVVPAAPAPAAAPAPVVTTPPPTTAPVETAPVATAPALPSIQSILYAMKGHEAVVFVAGRKVTGLIVGVDGDFVMMVDEDRDGKIAMIPKARITEIRGKTSSTPRPRSREGVELPPDGTGALAGGGVLVAIGGPLMISGLVFVGITPSYTPLWLPQVLPALLFLGGGIPLLVMGTRRKRAYQQALFENRLARRVAPTFGRTPGGGWTGGLSLRF